MTKLFTEIFVCKGCGKERTYLTGLSPADIAQLGEGHTKRAVIQCKGQCVGATAHEFRRLGGKAVETAVVQ